MSNGGCLVFFKMLRAGRKWSSIFGPCPRTDLWTLSALVATNVWWTHSGLQELLQAPRWVSFDLEASLKAFFFFCLISLPSFHWQSSQLHKYTAWLQGADGREQQGCTYPSLCNVICRTAFARQSTARTEAHLTCVRCVHSQGRQRHHKCSGTWWSQNCPWSRGENDTSEWCCGAIIPEHGANTDEDHAIYMQKRINKSVSLGLCRHRDRWIGRHSGTAKAPPLS